MRIHFVSNSLYINSGFGKVTRYLALGLKELGHEVTMTGLQTSQRIDYDYGIECFPIDSGGHIDETTQLILNVQKLRPDIVIYVGQLDADLNHLTKVFSPQICYIPVEGKNIPTMMANDIKFITEHNGKVIAQCSYGREEIRKIGVCNQYIYHGYDPKIFYPMTDEDFNKPIKDELVTLLIWEVIGGKGRWVQNDVNINKLKDDNIFKNKFVYLFVGQNFGLRKRIERLLGGYALLIKDNRLMKDRTHLHLHTLPMSIRGIDIIRVINELGINDNVSFSYGAFRSSGWSEEALNILYNLGDVNVSASSSEGFGLPTLESFACGLPNIGPDCSSFTELIGNDTDWRKNRGLLVNIIDSPMIQDGSRRALVDEKDLALKMKMAFNEKEKMKIFSENAIKWSSNYTWDRLILQWDKLLKSMK